MLGSKPEIRQEYPFNVYRKYLHIYDNRNTMLTEQIFL